MLPSSMKNRYLMVSDQTQWLSVIYDRVFLEVISSKMGGFWIAMATARWRSSIWALRAMWPNDLKWRSITMLKTGRHQNPTWHQKVYTTKHVMWDNIRTKLRAKDVLPNINRTQAAERAEKCHFVPSDLDLRPSNSSNRGTKNTSSVWTWHKSVQRFPQGISYTNKKPQTDSTRNRTFRSSLQFTACGNNCR